MKLVMTRRQLLRRFCLGSAAAILSGCAPQVVEKVVKETVQTEKQVEKLVTPALAPKGAVPILFWFQAENHKPEYEARIKELEDKFKIEFSYELLDRDAMNKKFPATLMAGSGFPDIIEMNADDVVKYMKGDDSVIPFLALNEVLATSPYSEQVLQSRWDRFTKDGKIYAAPHDVHPLVMLYHDQGWKEFGVDLTEVVTWDDYLTVCSAVDKEMPDGRPRYPLMDCTLCTNLPGRMLEKGIWWTDKAGEPMLTHPAFKECVVDWLRFRPFWVDIDWGNQVAMVKDGQVLSQLCPDWLYGIHNQGTAGDAEFLANSPMRVMRIPDFTADGPHTGTWGGTGCSVPKLTKERALSVEIMLYLYFENSNKELEKRYKDIGILPPVLTSWDGAGFHEPEPYVGGQVAAEVFIAAAKDLPSYSENWKTSLVAESWSEQFSLVWADEMGVDEAIEMADQTAREKIDAAQ
jgi:arabinosaccharide transport system substrate-binding protein